MKTAGVEKGRQHKSVSMNGRAPQERLRWLASDGKGRLEMKTHDHALSASLGANLLHTGLLPTRYCTITGMSSLVIARSDRPYSSP